MAENVYPTQILMDEAPTSGKHVVRLMDMLARLAGYVPTGRKITATLPMRVNGGASASLDADVALSLNAATSSAPGIMATATSAETAEGVSSAKAITPATLAYYLAGIGGVTFFAMNSTPAHFLFCNGAAVSRTTYAKLFAGIGTIFGVGDGSTTFNLPDLRGVFIRGVDGGRGLDPGRVFGSYQADAFQNHTGTFSGYELGRSADGEVTTTGVFYYSKSSHVGTSGSHGISPQFHFDPSRVARTATETRPKNVALRPCIRYR